MTWTPDRPTKPGRYEVSRHPRLRGTNELHTIERSVALIPRWLIDGGDAVEPRALAIRMDSGSEGAWIRVSDAVFDGALWRPYVEPPDPFAEPVPVEMYRMSDDAKTPNLRLILSVEPGEVVLYEADMTSRSATAKETAVYDKIIMSPADARWLRDALRQVDLSDPPEVTSTEPVPSLRERVEGLPTYDIDGEVWSLSVREVPGGEYLKRSEVLVLVDEVTR